MSKSNIYDKSLLYSFLRWAWTDGPIRRSFRKYEVHGTENIPRDGAVILTPNHCNTLMDALVVLRSYRGMCVFGGRADIFRKPFIARLLYFIRMVPIFRQRDGLRNVLQNTKTQDVIVDTLEHNVRFCIFPEGKHRTMHSLQKIGKGALRIALAANERFGKDKPVYIVPVGLEYGDYFRYRSTALVNFGKAINVTGFIEEGSFENEAQATEALKRDLEKRMADLITYLPDDEGYEDKWALTKMSAIYKSRKGYGDYGTSLYASMQKNRAIVGNMERLSDEAPDKMKDILESVRAFEAKRKGKGISIYSFRKMNPKWNAVSKGAAALLGLPYFIFSAITALPMWAIALKIRSGVKDPAFKNTVSFGVKLALGPILLLIYAILAFCLAPWWLAAGLLLLFIPSYYYFHDYIEGCRRWISDIRLLKNKRLYKEYKSIMKKLPSDWILAQKCQGK